MTATDALPELGLPAPDFTAPSTSGDKVTLSSFRSASNVVIAFFPLAFTSTCTAELCDFSAEYDLFSEAGVTILPVSVDSVATLKEYRAKYQMRTHLLSDFRRHISRQYGVLDEARFYATRSYFLVDPAGILRWRHVETVSGEKRSNGEILSALSLISDI